MSPKMSETDLLKHLADLPREIRPERDPWPEISSQIGRSHAGTGSSGQRSGWWLRAAAASIVLAVTAGLLLNSSWNENSRPIEPMASNPADAAVGGAPALFKTADAEYVAAFREFINIGSSSAELSPQIIEKIEGGWADLRTTEEALVTALEQNPGDPFLSARMLELRARQLGFLKQLVALDRNNRRMTI